MVLCSPFCSSCLPIAAYPVLASTLIQGRPRGQRQSACSSGCGQTSSPHPPDRGFCNPRGGRALPRECSAKSWLGTLSKSLIWNKSPKRFLSTRMFLCYFMRQVAGLLKDRDFALAGRSENGPARESWNTFGCLNTCGPCFQYVLLLSFNPVLKCEYCGNLAPASQFRGSKRFCSNTCAKRYDSLSNTATAYMFQNGLEKKRHLKYNLNNVKWWRCNLTFTLRNLMLNSDLFLWVLHAQETPH